MSSIAASGIDAGVDEPLRRARVAYRWRIAGIAALWSVAGAALALKFHAVLPGRPDGATAAALVLVTGLCIGLLVVARKTPNVLSLARRADREFALGERLSTALSVADGRHGWEGVLVGRLGRDASQRIAGVDASRLEAVAGWSTAVAAAALVASATVFWLAPEPGPAAVVAPVASAVVDETQRAANLEAIAAAIGADAKARQNDYLQAVSDAIGKLAQTPTGALSDADYNRQLSGLLEHAKLAYGKAMPAWLNGDAAAAADPFHLAEDQTYAGLAQAASGQSDDGRAGGGEEMVPQLLSEQGLLPNVAPPRPNGAIRITPQDPADMSINNQGVIGSNGTADSLSGKSSLAPPGGAAPSLGNEDPSSLGDLTGASGVPLGAATQSGAGSSRLAGAGTQGLDDANRAAAAPIAANDQVMLPADQYRPGKRIRITVAPQPGDGAAGETSGQALSSDGRQTPVTRDVPSVRDQAVFSRYFTHAEAD